MSNETERQQIKQALKDLIRLKCKTQNKMPLEVIREMQYELDLMKEEKEKEKK